ncbi:hypothetical protein ACH4M4_31260 [Streptomyces sp. NPDC017254]|uniref:hypothetical protein n=1 Tax=unclassified Streptomyces TaxID=2593676 RepID=UPI0037A8A947
MPLTLVTGDKVHLAVSKDRRPVVREIEPAARPGNAPVVDDLSAHILSLLVTGLTDQAIATQLRASLRTVQRRIRHLMDTAHVQNRMQPGFHTARLGRLEDQRDAKPPGPGAPAPGDGDVLSAG